MDKNGKLTKAEIVEGKPILKSHFFANILYRSVSFLSTQWIFLILLGFCAFFSLVAPGFFSFYNFLNISVYTTEVLIIALGQTLVIISGGFDLAVGSTLALSGVVAAIAMRTFYISLQNAGLSIAMGIIIGVMLATGIGVLNGVLITKLRINPFIVTLGTMGIARGLTYVLTAGASVCDLPPGMEKIGVGTLFMIPIPVVVTICLIILFIFILSKTRLGRYTYAIGGNREASVRAGIPVDKYVIILYAICGLCAGVSGMLVLGRFATASPMAGLTDNLDSITAVILGGAALGGGRGSIFGSVVGSFIIGTLLVGLIVIGVMPYWQMVSVGVILIIAVSIDQLRHRR